MARRIRTNGSAIPMEPGERTALISLQQKTLSRGTSGAPVETWSTIDDRVWARRMAIDPIRADYGEKFISNQVIAQPQSTWEIGYRADMDPLLIDVAAERRLVYLNRPYNIVAGDTIGAKEGIELICTSNGVTPL